MNSKEKCKYCGKRLLNANEFCSDECRNNYSSEVDSDVKKIKYFIVGIVLGVIWLFISVFINNSILLGSSIMFMGAIIILLPFSTPDTVKIFGYSKSKWIGRLMGIMLGLVGIWVAFC